MTLHNDSEGLSISKVTIDRPSAAIGEKVTLSFTLKVSSSASSGKASGDMKISILNQKTGSGKNVVTKSGISIAKGASKSFTVEFSMAEIATVTPGEYITISISVDNPYGYYNVKISDALIYLSERVAPVISSFNLAETTYNDTAPIVIYPPPSENLPKNIFGAYVQNVSKPKVTATVELDPLDTTLTAQHTLTFKQGDVTLYTITGSVPSGSAKFLTGLISVSGNVDYEYIVVDSAGMSSSVVGSFEVLEYTPAAIKTFTPKRYAYTYNDLGDLVLEEAEDGTIVAFDFEGSITQLSGNGASNYWKLSITYGRTYDENDRTTVEIATMTSGSAILSHEIKDVVFEDSDDYTFIAEFRDYFRIAKVTAEIYKAGADFDVTPDGVAVGMISTGTADQRKFEVAETHESFFHGGIAGVTNYPDPGVEKPTGGTWVNRNGDRVPVYWQVLVYNLTATGSTQNGPTIADFDELVSITGRFFRSAEGYYHQLNFYASSSDMNYAYMRSDGVLRVRSTDKAIVTAIVEYTKK